MDQNAQQNPEKMPESNAENLNSNKAKDLVFKSFQTGANAGKNYAIKVGVAIFTIILVCFVGSFVIKYMFDKTKQNIEDSLPFNSSSEEVETKFENPKEKNSPIIVGKVEWKILEAKDYGEKAPGYENDTSYCSAKGGYKFIYVKYSIRNADRLFVTIPTSSPDIYDEDKNEYEESAKTNKCLENKKSLSERLLPKVLEEDEKIEVEVLYEVREDAEGLKMLVGDLSTINKEFEYIDLDL